MGWGSGSVLAKADLSNIHQVAMNLGWGQLFQKGGAVPGAGAGNLQAPEYSAVTWKLGFTMGKPMFIIIVVLG